MFKLIFGSIGILQAVFFSFWVGHVTLINLLAIIAGIYLIIRWYKTRGNKVTPNTQKASNQ